MPMNERAAEFRAFDALAGYKEALKKVEKEHLEQYADEERYYAKRKSKKK